MKINAYIPTTSQLKKVEVFGYTSRSQPGLEIVGLSGKGRTIKEKITFLSKRRKLKFSLLRYVLCVEGEDLSKGDIEYLELPLMICFWTMAGILKMGRLDNCLCAGKVSLEGEIRLLDFPSDVLRNWDRMLGERGRLMLLLSSNPNNQVEYKNLRVLEVQELLKDVGDNFKIVA